MESETTPLIQDRVDSTTIPEASPVVSWQTALHKHFSDWKTIYLVSLFILVVDFPAFMRITPKLRMYELALCRDYYSREDPTIIAPDGSIEEEYCKLTVIQRELAMMRGLIGFLEAIPALLFALPYGILADKRGRKLVIGLGLLGQMICDSYILLILYFFNVFPTRAVLAASAFRCLGGGNAILLATCHAIIADASPSETRTRIFFYITVVMLITEMVSPPLGSYLMDSWNSYYAYLFGLPLEFLGFLVLAIIPETAKPNKDQEYSSHSSSSSTAEHNGRSWLKQRYHFLKTHIIVNVMPLLCQRAILQGLVALFVNRFSRSILKTLMQYLSARFGWKLGQTSYLVSLQALMHIIVLCTALPLIHGWLTKVTRRLTTADLVLGRGSSIFLILGSLWMGLAGNSVGIILGTVVFALGAGFAQAIRSFVTSLVSRENTGVLYMMIAIVDAVGSLVAPPFFGWSLAAGLKPDAKIKGLPFVLAALLYAISAISVWSIGSYDEKESTEEALLIDEE